MKVELSSLYKEYLKKESVYLEEEKSRLSNDKNRIMDAIRDIVERMGVDEESTPRESAKLQELRTVETNLSNIRRLKNEIERKLGRIEGMIEIAETRREEAPEEIIISASEMKEIVHEVNTFLDEALEKENLEEIKNIIQSIKNTLSKFEKKPEEVVIHSNTAEVDALKDSQRQILFEMERIEQEDRKTGEIIKKLKEEIQEEVEKGMDKERERFTLKVKHQELSSELQLNNVKEENIRRLIESYEGEIREGEAFIGEEIYLYKEYVFEGIVDRGLQEDLRRRIERIKIKLEDAGLSNGADILKEFEEVTERDAFLAKEMEDLAKSIESLHQLIAELKEKIHIEFETGIKKINAKFHEFFALMFGGGEASLSIVFSEKRKKSNADEDEDGEVVTEEDEEEFVPEEGVAIDIALPHKKVKELHSLSGGERSLTSIALLFAMSAVNPPPFLVLDETDAALDEANSRKYGDMLEKLSEHSQLIVVTHNRETMSRAGVLYGVTIGSDGASKLLSVKFDEAAAIAK
jgi:chromosome segregation protein